MPASKKPEARKVRKMSRQVMVALPAWVRRRVGVEAGATVWWHRHRAGEVVLTAKAGRPPGQPGRRDLEEELAGALAERDEWKRQALARQHGDARSWHADGYSAAIREYGSITNRLDVALTMLREQPGRLAGLVVEPLEGILAALHELRAPSSATREIGGHPLPPGVVAVELDPPG